MWRRPACQTLPKALVVSSATAGVALDLLTALTFLSDTTVARSAVDREDLGDEQVYYLQIFQRLY